MKIACLKKLTLFLIVNLISIHIHSPLLTKDHLNGLPLYGLAEMQGRRITMEDAHCIVIQKEHAFFGLFDGHGGKAVADFVARNLYQEAKNVKSSCEMPEALFKGYGNVHAQLSNKIAWGTGTTAVSVWIEHNTLYVANAGDSRIVLSSKGLAIPLSLDHKPDRVDERKRIEQAGGFIFHHGVWRVQGILAVSRAIGDKSLNPYVIPEPEMTVRTITDNDEFLILACDGVWDVFDNQQAVDIVQDSLKKHRDFTLAAQSLVKMAYDAGSTDNISVIVVDLQGIRSYLR